MIEKLVYVVRVSQIPTSRDKVKICRTYCFFSACYFVVVLNTLTVMTFIYFFCKSKIFGIVTSQIIRCMW